MKPSDIENLGADQRYGVYMAAGAVKGIGKILFSHSDGGIEGMRSNEVDTLYMGLIALGQFIESAMDDVDSDISRLAHSLEPAE